MLEIQLNKRIEGIHRMSAEELKSGLARLLDDIRKRGIKKTMEQSPWLLSNIIGKLLKIDSARYFGEAPEVSDMFMDLFWEGVGLRAVISEELRSALDKTTRTIHVNIEASDSPLKGHFIASRGKLSGGSGMVHFKEEDYRLMGPTEVLLQLLMGELALGFSNLRLQTAGHSGFASLVASLLRGVSSSIKSVRS